MGLTDMKQKQKDKTLIYLAWISTIYHLLLIANAYIIRSTHIAVGIIRESLSLPMAIFHLVVLVLTFTQWADKEKCRPKGSTFWAVVGLLSIVIYFLLSIVINRLTA